MNITFVPNAVEQGYGGGDTFMPRVLRDATSHINSNFQQIQVEIDRLNIKYRETQAINKQLVQLLNWIATTNPQILDEFQTTATAFDKLIPRDDGAGTYASPQA